MTYIKGALAVIAVAFVITAYTFVAMMVKHKAVGLGVIQVYFTRPIFWLTLVVNCIYAYVITVER